MPKPAMSKSAAPTDIISIAQQARPNVAGQTLLRRAHLTRSSSAAGQEIVLEVLEAHGRLLGRPVRRRREAGVDGVSCGVIRLIVDSDVRSASPSCSC